MRTLVLGLACFILSARAQLAPTLCNASCRLPLANGATATLGFVVTAPGDFLIRSVGPSLRKFGVSEPAGHPTVELFSKGIAIAHNDNWITGDYVDLDSSAAWISWFSRSGPLSRATTAAGAFPLTSGPFDQAVDSALLMHLEPGVYTVLVTNRGAAGEALLEVYAIPPSL